MLWARIEIFAGGLRIFKRRCILVYMNSTKCPHGTYGSGCGYCGIAPTHSAFGIARPAAIIEEAPTPELVAERLARADELERNADLLHSALLAPSMKEAAMRDEAAELRRVVS